jgi:hypothetical protein
MEIHAVNTWFDKRHGVIALDGDVLGIVERVKEIGDGRLSVYYNPQSDGFDVVETCLDHTERLVFSVDALDARVLDRLHQADQWGGETPDRGIARPEGDDFLDEVDRHNEALDRAKDEAATGKLHEAGERLAWSLDLVSDRPSVGGSIHVKKDLDG